MRTTANNNPYIAEHLTTMEKKDTWIMLLFALYKLRDDPDWLVLSELSYILDTRALVKFLSYFENMTIKIPPMRDLHLLLHALTLYKAVAFDNLPLDKALRAMDTSTFSRDEIKQTYVKILDVVKDYDFKA